MLRTNLNNGKKDVSEGKKNLSMFIITNKNQHNYFKVQGGEKS
jgi:hypothetical protein